MKNDMTITETISKILELHTEYFIPAQYGKKQKETKLIPCIRVSTSEDRAINVDIIVWNEKIGHEFVDGNFYSNGDGIGMGNTFKEALNDLLEKTEDSISDGLGSQ